MENISATMEVHMENYALLGALIDDFKLEVLSGKEGYRDTKLYSNDVNRAGLQFSGFLDYYDSQRIQILGNAEVTFLQKIDVEKLLYNHHFHLFLYSQYFLQSPIYSFFYVFYSNNHPKVH